MLSGHFSIARGSTGNFHTVQSQSTNASDNDNNNNKTVPGFVRQLLLICAVRAHSKLVSVRWGASSPWKTSWDEPHVALLIYNTKTTATTTMSLTTRVLCDSCVSYSQCAQWVLTQDLPLWGGVRPHLGQKAGMSHPLFCSSAIQFFSIATCRASCHQCNRVRGKPIAKLSISCRVVGLKGPLSHCTQMPWLNINQLH